MLLAAIALFGAGALAGWQGVMLVACAFVGWLLVQFRRLMRVMDEAGRAPLGAVADAAALDAQLRAGMKLEELVALTRSLGAKTAAAEPTYAWTDPGGTRVEVVLAQRRVASWRLVKPAPDGAAP
ncbi:MAG: hypothetical protein JO224_14115 [Pelomonas sp.]|nr:hypothetical protein [Roseateles sp.]